MDQHETPYYIHKEVVRILSNAKKAVYESDQDRVFIVTGDEGSGKSKFARQIAYFFDKTFNVDDIVFNGDDFKKRIRSVPKHKAIVFDEAFRGLSSRGALSKMNKQLVRLLQECRQRNLFVFIVLPSVFLLEKYVALFRSKALFHVKIFRKDFKKRYYQIYDKESKQLLYMLGQKLMSYSRPRIMKKYNFFNKEPPTINEPEYNKKKYRAFLEDEETEDIDTRLLDMRTSLSLLLKEEYKMTYVDQAKHLIENGLPITSDGLSQIALKRQKALKRAKVVPLIS